MINVPLARQALHSTPGDVAVYHKSQMDLLLGEVEKGQRAIAALAQLTVAAVAATSAGLVA